MAFGQPRIEYKTNAQMRTMHEAGLVLSRALDAAVAAAAPGVTTGTLDDVFAAVLQEAGAKSNFLGYHGFPATICTSVNEEVVHGIPGDRVLQDGDIISIDGGAIVDGWHSDSARTVIVGHRRSRGPAPVRRHRGGHVARHRRPGDRQVRGRHRQRRGRLRLLGARASRWASSRTTSATASARRCTWLRTC